MKGHCWIPWISIFSPPPGGWRRPTVGGGEGPTVHIISAHQWKGSDWRHPPFSHIMSGVTKQYLRVVVTSNLFCSTDEHSEYLKVLEGECLFVYGRRSIHSYHMWCSHLCFRRATKQKKSRDGGVKGGNWGSQKEFPPWEGGCWDPSCLPSPWLHGQLLVGPKQEVEAADLRSFKLCWRYLGSTKCTNNTLLKHSNWN